MSDVTVSRERTSYETESRGNPDQHNVRPGISSKSVVIQRTAAQTPGRGHSLDRSLTTGMAGGAPAGTYSTISNTGINSVKSARIKEKQDMADLNDRLAGYVEKVRFLETQNKKTGQELQDLKNRWGKETGKIKAMYQAELDEARKLLDESEKDKGRLEIRCSTLEEEVEDLRRKNQDLVQQAATDREKIERQNQQLSDYEAEINLLRRRIEALETDHERDKAEIARLTEALNRARMDLDNESLNHIDAENRRQTLEEELEFLKQVHDQELKELAALAYRDTTNENREFWKNEMGQALREIQDTYDEKMELMRGEMEAYYNLKIQEFRTGASRQNMETIHAKEDAKRLRQMLADLRAKLAELEAKNTTLERELDALRNEYAEKEREWEAENNELKSEVAKLRAEMEAILKELQDIMDTKLGLELEIAAYRKLIEGEESRRDLDSRSPAEQSSKRDRDAPDRGYSRYGEDQQLKVSQVVKGEMSAKTSFSRSAKGPISISECSSDGKFIGFENTGKQDQNIGGWRISRQIEGRDKPIEFTIPPGFSVRASSKSKIWAGPRGVGSSSADGEAMTLNSWGIGANITTKLLNPLGEERATHVQRTVYTS